MAWFVCVGQWVCRCVVAARNYNLCGVTTNPPALAFARDCVRTGKLCIHHRLRVQVRVLHGVVALCVLSTRVQCSVWLPGWGGSCARVWVWWVITVARGGITPQRLLTAILFIYYLLLSMFLPNKTQSGR